MGNDSANVTFIVDYFKNSNLFNTERGTLGTANQTAQGGQDFRSSRGYPGRFILTGMPGTTGPTTFRDPQCPAESIAGQTCLYDFGPWNVLLPESERTGAMTTRAVSTGSRLQIAAGQFPAGGHASFRDAAGDSVRVVPRSATTFDLEFYPAGTSTPSATQTGLLWSDYAG